MINTSTPFDDHQFHSLFAILPNHDSLFCFIVEEPGFGRVLVSSLLCHWELILLTFVLPIAAGSSQSDWGFIWQWSPLYKFEHTPNRESYSDSYPGWGNMTAVLLHLIIIAALLVLIYSYNPKLSFFLASPTSEIYPKPKSVKLILVWQFRIPYIWVSCSWPILIILMYLAINWPQNSFQMIQRLPVGCVWVAI